MTRTAPASDLPVNEIDEPLSVHASRIEPNDETLDDDAPDSQQISSTPDVKRIFDTSESDTGSSVDSTVDLASHPIDVDQLASQWLSRATQTSREGALTAPRAEFEEDSLPTLESDETTVPPSEEPDSAWLRDAEAANRRQR